jgi:V/A-type H+-transporting ATPase subunit D
METNTFPTKGNLIKTKSTLALSKTGYDLLDKKRNILVREMMLMIEQAKVIQSQIDITFSDAYKALQQANISIGINTVDQISNSVKAEERIEIKVRSIMGVEIPMVNLVKEDLQVQYGLARTPITLDEAYDNFSKVKELTIALAEVENAIYRLAINIKRTQKRANALKNILIPRYTKLTKSIQNALEEKEREEFTRLKMIKNIQK